LYKFDKEKKTLETFKRIPNMAGSINALKFSKDRSMLVATHSKEQKLGRWHVQPKSKEGISIVKCV